MPTEQQQAGEASSQNDNNSTGGEPEEQSQQQDPTPGEGGNGGQQQAAEPVITKDTKIPDDHPLVKALAKANEKVAGLAEAQAQAAKATKLEEELAARPSKEALDTLQTRYDRLEAFLLEAGGPISKALDSRTFTRDLFETDKDVADLVKDWHKANPSATSSALSTAAAGETGKGKHDPNELIRAAFRGTK
ncbi:scaffolding protein [Microbacterium phage Oats]|uniref:Scaffolding protein n=9 Tax=Ilzatvirus ilzat TaxID=2560593 RepID=A0A5J6THU0_9CAUD|nr:scaffolding protein [Microbacterium phage Aubergine]AUX82779.1 scaffolding protein [Microbacterium phage Espinosa]AUX82904.1 scaffolding protein [Microbacterium phage Kale]AUX83407.1 scaffolding protein [Microbacterium phage Tenda]AVR56548.1 scaffolding protein [Microbacterium phage TeddyBear]AWN03783.1 scaffolding protein [Microbacterium phage Oats]QFG09487.1 scaffolding protein [Microbacterium phage Gershwin]QFG11901.1 scaffolding protein [Microbacterium phage ManRay]QFG13707.1 scaffol